MSLSDILISLLLSSLLASLLLHQYASLSHSSQQFQTQMNRRFEQNLITRMLADSATQAGFLPCGSITSFDVYDASQSQWITLKALIAKPNQLITHYMDGDFQALSSEHPNHPVISQQMGLHPKQKVLLTNCRYSELNYIHSITSLGTKFKINLAYPTRFIIDNDSYIGRWHHDQFDYHHQILWFGDKKKERLTQDLIHFNIELFKDNLVFMAWQYQHLPDHEQIIFLRNRLS